MTMIMLKKNVHAYKRGGSHADLSLPNRRRRLLRTVMTAKGPIMLMLVGNHPLDVG